MKRSSVRTLRWGLVWLMILVACVAGPACKKETPPAARSDVPETPAEPVTPPGDTPGMVDGKLALRILYVGLPDTERQQDFVSFLTRHFQSVKTADLYAFKEEQAQDSDVILLDKDGVQWGSEGGRPLSDLRLSAQYTRPTVSLGIPGAFLTDRMGQKTGYM